MNDMYSEKLVRRKPSSKIIAIKAAIATVTMLLAYFAFYFLCSSLSLIGFMPAAVALIIFIGWKAFTFFNVEFECTVTNGTLDVDKIVARKSRKRLGSIQAKNLEIVAPYTNEYKAQYETGNFKETIDARAIETDVEGVWFAIGEMSGKGRIRILFEPSEKMLYIFEKNVPLKMPFRPEIDPDSFL